VTSEVFTDADGGGPLVRPAVAADAPAVGRVHVRAWQRAYRGGLLPDDELDALDADARAERWALVLGGDPPPRSARLVVEVDGVVAGFVVVGPERGRNDAGGGDAGGGDAGGGDAGGEVHVLNVDPDAWGTGAGRALLTAGEQALTDAGFEGAVLWVHPGNTRARRFYERHGWVDDGAERVEEIWGVEVPEVRYRRELP
jgi:ribosomal protein S18 acetylase RimI-like enzyme